MYILEIYLKKTGKSSHKTKEYSEDVSMLQKKFDMFKQDMDQGLRPEIAYMRLRAQSLIKREDGVETLGLIVLQQHRSSQAEPSRAVS